MTMENFKNILFHKSEPTNKQRTHESINLVQVQNGQIINVFLIFEFHLAYTIIFV